MFIFRNFRYLSLTVCFRISTLVNSSNSILSFLSFKGSDPSQRFLPEMAGTQCTLLRPGPVRYELLPLWPLLFPQAASSGLCFASLQVTSTLFNSDRFMFALGLRYALFFSLASAIPQLNHYTAFQRLLFFSHRESVTDFHWVSCVAFPLCFRVAWQSLPQNLVQTFPSGDVLLHSSE